MPYTLSEAAAATGHNRSAIFKAIKKGALSAHRDEATGHWLVEAAELHRLYPAVMPDIAQGTPGNGQGMAGNAELREVRARLADAHDQIEDLRRRLDTATERLDAEAEERRRLTAIIADQRAAPAPRRWWPWKR